MNMSAIRALDMVTEETNKVVKGLRLRQALSKWFVSFGSDDDETLTTSGGRGRKGRKTGDRNLHRFLSLNVSAGTASGTV